MRRGCSAFIQRLPFHSGEQFHPSSCNAPSAKPPAHTTRRRHPQVYAKRPDGPDVRPYKERLAELRAKLAGLDYPHAWPAQVGCCLHSRQEMELRVAACGAWSGLYLGPWMLCARQPRTKAGRLQRPTLLACCCKLHTALTALLLPTAHALQRVAETERGVFLLRQYLHANLAQRVSTRPFLTLIEKVGPCAVLQLHLAVLALHGAICGTARHNATKHARARCRQPPPGCNPSPLRPSSPQRWLAYQLLLALAQCHGRGVCHGDIKPENVGLTSWDWAFLIDFAPYKPTLLPADNPADFSFFFDTSGRRRCYLAPERFVDPAAGLGAAAAVASPLTPAMVGGGRGRGPA